MNNGIGKKPRENLTGRLFGRLTVERPAEDGVLSNGRHLTMWECRCSCGNHTIIRSSDLKSGRVVSCGCYRAENTGVIRTTHGATKGRKTKKLYSVWASMRERCKNPNNTQFAYYGGKGVYVCSEWDSSYSTFEEWALNSGYQEGLTIDRIDVNGNYCPKNCRWATVTEQANNKTTNRLLGALGKTKSIAEWARELNMSYNKLYHTLSKNGWDIEKAVMPG